MYKFSENKYLNTEKIEIVLIKSTIAPEKFILLRYKYALPTSPCR